MLKKAASGVLALLPCSRAENTLRASKGLRPFLRLCSGLDEPFGKSVLSEVEGSGHAFLTIPLRANGLSPNG